MNRRKLLTSAVQAGIAGALLPASSLAQASDSKSPDSKIAAARELPSTPTGLIGEAATSAYFSPERLHHALGTKDLSAPSDVTVIAFNFPSWHPSPYMEEHFGKGWTEFDTLRNSRALFPGHTMPHFPLWGYYDESDPAWAAREIDLASTYGVDAWMVDWYWHDGLQFYQEQIERGLLKASNRDKLKFGIMWANHDWKNVYPARSPDSAAILTPQLHSIKDFERVCNYCAEHYFSQPNYLTFDGAPVFGIFDAGKVVEQLGEEGLRRSLAVMRERAHKLGFPRLHLQVCNGFSKYQERLRDLGFDSAVQYGTFGWTYGSKTPGSRIPYGVGAYDAVVSWPELQRNLQVPFHPTCSVGWDDSPRFGDFSCVAINRSPDQFERLVRAARHFVASQPEKRIYLNAWNEWTEDGVLLPDTYWGYSYLEALRRAVKD